jgi:hypothetical protein
MSSVDSNKCEQEDRKRAVEDDDDGEETGPPAKKSRAVPAAVDAAGPSSGTEATRRSGRSKKATATAIEIESEDEGDAAAAPSTRPAPAKPAPKKSKKKATAPSTDDDDEIDAFHIALAGDDDGTVPIYDSCDEIRSKILAELERPGRTKAAFLRDIARAGFPHTRPKINLQSKQLTDFLDKSGATSGSTSRIFYGAYVFFEKRRLAEYATAHGKDANLAEAPKTSHRRAMERQWAAEGGMPRERPRGYWVSEGSDVFQDDVGRVVVCRV